MCQEMEFCQLQNCPLGSTCQNLDNGYECIANATFDGRNMSLSYSLHAASSFNVEQLDTVSITYRSRTGKCGSVTDNLQMLVKEHICWSAEY
jgi:protein crumbs